MEDRHKTRGQLVIELAELRQRIAQLEASEIEGGRAIEALWESETRYRNLFENSVLGIYRATLDGQILEANPAFVQMLGYSSFTELARRNLRAEGLDPGRNRSTFKERIAREGQVVGMESVWTKRDGAIVFVRENARVIYDEEGNVLYYEGTVEDITERKLAEEAMHRARQQLQDTFDHTPAAVYAKDLEGRYILVNQQWRERTGLGEQDVIGKTDRELFPHFTDEAWDQHEKEVLESGKAIQFEEIGQTTGRVYLATKFVLRDTNGQVYALCNSSLDITERKEAEEELREHREHLEELVKERTAELEERVAEVEQLNRAMTDLLKDMQAANHRATETARQLQEANAELESFAYSVSHDLRAPLRHIDGFVQLLLKRERGKLDPTSARYLNIVAESSDKMSVLIDNLLTFSRTGRAAMQIQRFELEKLVGSVRQELAPILETRQVDWEIGPLPAVEADPALLRQVWINLLSNAIKFTAPRKEARIEIGATRRDTDDSGEITLFVRDNGVGFDPKYTHKLFGVFQRLHLEDEFEGAGIGLAIVRRIIYRHGGRVWAEGKVDRGATFYFTLRKA